jgi:hypothetical protein
MVVVGRRQFTRRPPLRTRPVPCRAGAAGEPEASFVSKIFAAFEDPESAGLLRRDEYTAVGYPGCSDTR